MGRAQHSGKVYIMVAYEAFDELLDQPHHLCDSDDLLGLALSLG